MPPPGPRPTPSPVTTTTTTLPPTPERPCTFPQGVPDHEFQEMPSRPALHDLVNAAVARVGGCEVGSDCPLGPDPQAALARIAAELRRAGLCAGMHREGESDELAVALRGGCADGWEGHHSVKWPRAQGDQAKAVWSRVPWEPCMGSACVLLGGGAYRGAWLIPPARCAPGPTPTPKPLPTVPPSTLPPVQGACRNPTPGPLARMEAKLHIEGPNWLTLDATPLVGRWDSDGAGNRWCGRDWDYCRAMGWTDGRGYCPPRQEGHPQRLPCDLAITGGGIAWTWNGRPVTDDDGDADVQMHPGGWMLQVRRGQVGIARACPRVLSGCDEQCGQVAVGP